METTLEKVVVFDQRMYHGNGVVHKWAYKITTKFTEEARRYAPVGETGSLVAGIKGNVRVTGEREIEGTIESRSPHTMYVLRGTGFPGKGKAGWIFPTDSPYMIIPASRGYHEMRRGKVHGQSPNNFLMKAWSATARNHRAIRGATVPAFIRHP